MFRPFSSIELRREKEVWKQGSHCCQNHLACLILISCFSCWIDQSLLLVLLSPESDDMDPDLARVASVGFTGCLSVVRFNSISPLKAALLHPDTSPVVITGPLVQSSCGSSASANPYAAENTHHLSGRRGEASQFNWNSIYVWLFICSTVTSDSRGPANLVNPRSFKVNDSFKSKSFKKS